MSIIQMNDLMIILSFNELVKQDLNKREAVYTCGVK